MQWNKQTAFFWLLGVFLFSFLLYLPIYESTKIRLSLLLATLFLGTLWAWLASGTVILYFKKHINVGLLGLLVMGLVLNIGTLVQGMPWRGDEDSNVDFVVIFSNLIPFQWFFAKCAALIVTAWLVCKYTKLSKSLQLLVAALLVVVIAYWAYHLSIVGYYMPFQYNLIISRLPYFIRMLPVFPVIAAKSMGIQYTEWLYRILPFLSAVLLAYTVAGHYSKDNKTHFFAIGLLVLTLPTVFFYSSILYLELTGLLLLTYVLLHADKWLRNTFVEMRQQPYWLAFIGLGFVKETFLFVVLVLLAMRLFTRIIVLRKYTFNQLLNEMVIVFVALLPLVYYLFIRYYNGNVRPGALSFDHLKQWNSYLVLLKSFWQQFGVFALLFPAALVSYALQKNYVKVLLFLGGVVGVSFVFAADSGGIYAGYSRFNLLVLPFFLVAAMDVLQTVLIKSKQIAYGVFAIILAINFVLCPIHLDGSKEAYWGDYGYDTAEHYYPFKEALQFTKEKGFTQVTLLTNDYQPYFLRFNFQFQHLQYAPQLGITVNGALNNSSQAIAAIQNILNSGVQAVIVQVHEYDLSKKNTQIHPYLTSLTTQLSGLQVKILSNSAHTLLVVYR